MEVTPNLEHKNQFVLFYHDMPEGWPAIGDTDNSCQHKVGPHQAHFAHFLAPVLKIKCCALTQMDAAHTAVNVNDPQFSNPGGFVRNVYGQRPRWWYIAVADCDENQIQNVSLPEFKITFLNQAASESHFKQQFSMEEQGIYEAQIFTSVILAIMFCLFGRQMRKTKGESISVVRFALLLSLEIVIFFKLTAYRFSRPCSPYQGAS